jgi:hypothetical protein
MNRSMEDLSTLTLSLMMLGIVLVVAVIVYLLARLF